VIEGPVIAYRDTQVNRLMPYEHVTTPCWTLQPWPHSLNQTLRQTRGGSPRNVMAPANAPSRGSRLSSESGGMRLRYWLLCVVAATSILALVSGSTALAQATMQQAPKGSLTCVPNEQEELRVYHGCTRPSQLGVPQAVMKCRNYWNGAQAKCDRMCVFARCHRA
jgi:hypothetical protein